MLLTPKTVREICENNQIFPHKQLGQNFMVDSSQVQKIVRLGEVKEDDYVIEVGPGLGSLTLGLLKTGAKVLAVEIDKKLAKLLPKTVAEFSKDAENLTVLEKDALLLKFEDLPDEFKKAKTLKLISNLPYSVGTNIFLTLIERFSNLDFALILVQSEVAKRIAAEPGSKIYGIPSVKTAFFGKSKVSGIIPRSAFYPVPRVDSELVLFQRNSVQFNSKDETFSLINLAFSARRKTLRSLLVNEGNSSEKVTNVLDSLQIDPLARGETLNVEQFRELAIKLNQN